MDSISSCIYSRPHGLCSGTAPFGDEHYLPRGLGNFLGYERLKNKICRECNTRFGSELEDVLLHIGPVAALREMAGLVGRKKHRRKPIFHERTRGYDPIRLVGSGAEGESKILWEAAGIEGRPLRQILFLKTSGETQSIPLPKDIQSKDDLIALLARENVSNLKPLEFYPDPDDPDGFEKMQQLCGEVFGKRANKRTLPGDRQVNTTYNFLPPPAYRIAVAKIGFHFFLKMFPECSGFESELNEIKRLIYKGGEPTRFVSEVAQQIPEALSPILNWAHILYADWEEDYFRARIQLFAGLQLGTSKKGVKVRVASARGHNLETDTQTAPLTWVVHLGRNRSSRNLGTRSLAFVAYSSRHDGADGRVQSLDSSI